MTRTPLSRSKVKGQGHQAALLSAALTRKAAAAVSVETFGVGKYCYVASAQQRANGGGEGQGHIVSPRSQLVTDKLSLLPHIIYILNQHDPGSALLGLYISFALTVCREVPL